MVLRLALAVVLAVSAFSLDASAQRRGRGNNGYGGYDGITVYEDPHFRGDSVTFRNAVTDLRGEGLNDRVSSLVIDGNQAWEVCRDVNFSGPCRVFSGTIDDLRAEGWNDRISSMRAVGFAGNNNGRWGNNGGGRGNNGGGWSNNGGGWGNGNNRQSRLVFYDRTNFRGDARDIFNNATNLGSIGDRARSVQVYGGTWELCDGSSRNGRCVTVSQSVSDLRSLGLRNGISSAREVGYQNQNRGGYQNRPWWQ
jgi:beta/gamma crystallin